MVFVLAATLDQFLQCCSEGKGKEAGEVNMKPTELDSGMDQRIKGKSQGLCRFVDNKAVKDRIGLSVCMNNSHPAHGANQLPISIA